MGDCNCKDGARGPMGLQGPKGDTGATGPAGPAGAIGAKGEQGIAGPTGPKGRDGIDGAIGPQGPTGPAGVPGLDGAPGAPGANGADGAKGDKGDQGPQGPQGLQGPKGDKGDSVSTTGFFAEGPPETVGATAILLGSNDLCDAGAVVMLPTLVYDDYSREYDSSTGIWTVGTPGRYTLDFYISMKVGAGWSAGRVTAGLIDPSGCNFYTVDTQEGAATYQYLHFSGSVTMYLAEGTQIALKVMNATTTGYVKDANDVARFSATKIG